MTDATADDLDRSDMARLGAGQDAALNDLMGRHAERLYHYLLRLLQNETEAADLAEEAFVRVYQNRTKFKTTTSFPLGFTPSPPTSPAISSATVLATCTSRSKPNVA